MTVPNTAPLQTGTPRIVVSALSVANTNRDGSTGTYVTVWDNTLTSTTSSPIYGSRVRRLTVTATGTTTAGVVRLFVGDGSTVKYHSEALVTAITPSTTIKPYTTTFTLDMDLGPSCLLKMNTNNAETFHVVAEGNDY